MFKLDFTNREDAHQAKLQNVKAHKKYSQKYLSA